MDIFFFFNVEKSITWQWKSHSDLIETKSRRVSKVKGCEYQTKWPVRKGRLNSSFYAIYFLDLKLQPGKFLLLLSMILSYISLSMCNKIGLQKEILSNVFPNAQSFEIVYSVIFKTSHLSMCEISSDCVTFLRNPEIENLPKSEAGLKSWAAHIQKNSGRAFNISS